MRRKSLLIILCIIIAILLTFHLFFTTRGVNLVAKLWLSRYAPTQDIEIKKIDGTITRTLSLHEISIGNLKLLPPGTVVEIKKVVLDVNPFDLEGIYVDINSAKINIPEADPILFHGTYTNGSLDLNIYAKSIGMAEIRSFLNDNNALGDIKGNVENIDMFVKGPLEEPELTGKLHIERLSRDAFSIIDCPVSLNLKFKDIKTDLKMSGEMVLDGGSVSGPKTAVVKLQQSKIFFKGEPKIPEFYIRGLSEVEGTKINITLKGTIENPDIKLSSEPALSNERLLLMLATNKKWGMTEDALIKGQNSLDIARDFLDYFVFAGSGSKLAQYFGVKAFTFKYDDKTKSKGVGVKKGISTKAEASYAIEKKDTQEKDTVTTHKLGSEYRVTDTDSVAIEVEREIKQDKLQEAQDKTEISDKVFLEYKKQF